MILPYRFNFASFIVLSMSCIQNLEMLAGRPEDSIINIMCAGFGLSIVQH